MSEREVGFAVREAGDGVPFLEESLVVPYGERISGTPEYGSLTEEFDPGSFRDHGTAVLIDVHYGTPVSGRLPARDTPRGWVVGPGPLLDTERAREFAAAVREGVIGPSVEFDARTTEKRRTKTGIAHRRVKTVGAIAGTYRAAYKGGAFAVRHMEGSNVPEEIETLPETPAASAGIVAGISAADAAQIARTIAEDAVRGYAARSALGPEVVDPFADWRGLTLGQMAERALNSDERRFALWPQMATRALDDIVTTAGANAGMVTPGVFGDVHAIVSRGRPAITAFGGPRAIPDQSGMTVDWPYFDGTLTDFVAAQSAEKAAIETAVLNIKKGSEALVTYAGGADISYQLLRRANSSYLDVWTRIMLTAWGVVTDAAFVTELETGTVTSDFAEALAAVDATEFKNLVIDASIAVQTATGQPAEFVLASTTAFTQFAKLFTPIVSMPTVTNTGAGTLDLRSLSVNIGNIPLIHVPSITAGKLIVSNRLAAAWYEDGPFQAQAEDVEKLGKNVAIWSMGAGARFIPAGVVEMYDVTP